MTQKTLFITGASSGIGAATAEAAVATGWNVALFARSEDKLTGMADKLGEAALALPGDVTDLSGQETAMSKAAEHFGSIDAVFANAGRGLDTPGILDGDPEEWRGMIDLNVMGMLYTVRAAYPHLKKTSGHLVLTGSVAGKIHLPGSIYGASKWFVQGLAGNLAKDMQDWGGRCTLIAPGMVDTAFFDEAKPDKLKPEDIAEAVTYAINAPNRATVREVVVMPTN